MTTTRGLYVFYWVEQMRGKRSKLWYCTHNFCLVFGEELLTHHPRISGNTSSHPFKNIFTSMRATKSCPPSKINRPLEIWWMVLWCLHPRQRTQPNGSYWEGHPWQADYPRPPRGGCRCRWRPSKGLHFMSYSHLSDSPTGGGQLFVEGENAVRRLSFPGKLPYWLL